MPRPTLSQRAMASALRRTTKLLQGYTPDFLDEMVATLGIAGFFKWSTLLYEATVALDKRWGHGVGQLLVGSAAMWNGCRYCGVGHTYAGNLWLYRETGELLPLDERDIVRLQDMRDDDALAELMRILDGEHYREIRGLLERLYRLKFGELAPETDDDYLLLRTIAAWDLVNECSIMSQMHELDDIEALSPMAKDAPLIARYQAARGRPVSSNR